MQSRSFVSDHTLLNEAAVSKKLDILCENATQYSYGYIISMDFPPQLGKMQSPKVTMKAHYVYLFMQPIEFDYATQLERDSAANHKNIEELLWIYFHARPR